MTRRDRDRLVADLTDERDAALRSVESADRSYASLLAAFDRACERMREACAEADRLRAERDEWRRLAEGGDNLHRSIMERLHAEVPDPEVTP